MPYWSTQRNWLLSPVENKAIKRPQSRHSRKKPWPGFLCTVWWLQARERALWWPCKVGSHIPLSSWSWSSCCQYFGVRVNGFGFFFGLSLDWKAVSYARVSAAASQVKLWGVHKLEFTAEEWDTCLVITLVASEQLISVQTTWIWVCGLAPGLEVGKCRQSSWPASNAYGLCDFG